MTSDELRKTFIQTIDSMLSQQIAIRESLYLKQKVFRVSDEEINLGIIITLELNALDSLINESVNSINMLELKEEDEEEEEEEEEEGWEPGTSKSH